MSIYIYRRIYVRGACAYVHMYIYIYMHMRQLCIRKCHSQLCLWALDLDKGPNGRQPNGGWIYEARIGVQCRTLLSKLQVGTHHSCKNLDPLGVADAAR